MLIYEAERSDRRDYLYCQRDHNFSFPAHLHHSYEFLTVQAGVMTCTLETKSYAVHPGEGLLVLPDQIHSYHTQDFSQSVLWVFSDDWVPEFSAQLGQRAYLVCGTALEQCTLCPRPHQDADAHLTARIINYVQANYTRALTLEEMAREFGYNYTYLSAYFNQRLHTGFQDFVNQYRVSHAAALLQGSSLPITQVAEQCGFGTIRSFNRVFHKAQGMSPSDFRRLNR